MARIRTLVIAASILVAASFVSSSVSQEQSAAKLIKDWLVRYHDRETVYFEFPNGLIAKVGSGSKLYVKYVDPEHIVLWLCKWPARFHLTADANLYLAGKAVRWTEEGGEQMEGRYEAQCQLGEYAGPLRQHLASR